MLMRPAPSTLEVRVLPQNPGALTPGAAGIEMFAFEITNRAAFAETLTAVAMTNATTGPGAPPQLDADWLPLLLVGRRSKGWFGVVPGRPCRVRQPRRARAGGRDGAVPDRFGASLTARDGDLLDLKLVAPVESPVLTTGHPVRPLATAHRSEPSRQTGWWRPRLRSARQRGPNLLTGSTRTLVMDAVIPQNGYQPDTLRFLMTRNEGTALPSSDVSVVEAWIDDGDGVFEPSGAGQDSLLGECRLSGGNWVLAGISAPVPFGGLRVFLSCDIPANATEGRTVQLALPS
jgi:hypothetical protein